VKGSFANPFVVAAAAIIGLIWTTEPTLGANHTGKLIMLRVHDVGTGYGNPNMDVDVVVRLNSEPNNAFGFQLRNDANRDAHEGMLALLRDAFQQNYTVYVDEDKGVIFRVWIVK